MSRLTRVAGTSTVLTALSLAVAAPAALAVQTDTFSLTATGERTSIVVTAGSGKLTDHFVLHNLTSKPITIAVKPLSLTAAHGTFTAGPPGVGFSANVKLPAGSVPLEPHQTKTLPVRIDTDYQQGHSGLQFAVIDAQQVRQTQSGSNGVPHLQLAIELKPSTHGSSEDAGSGWSAGKIAVVAIAAALVLAGLVAWLLVVLARRRQA